MQVKLTYRKKSGKGMGKFYSILMPFKERSLLQSVWYHHEKQWEIVAPEPIANWANFLLFGTVLTHKYLRKKRKERKIIFTDAQHAWAYLVGKGIDPDTRELLKDLSGVDLTPKDQIKASSVPQSIKLYDKNQDKPLKAKVIKHENIARTSTPEDASHKQPAQRRKRKTKPKDPHRYRMFRILSWMHKFEDPTVYCLTKHAPTHRCYILGLKGGYRVHITTVEVAIPLRDLYLEIAHSGSLGKRIENWNTNDASSIAIEWFHGQYQKSVKWRMPFTSYKAISINIVRKTGSIGIPWIK